MCSTRASTPGAVVSFESQVKSGASSAYASAM
jgi:hypothetical protein